MPTTANYKITTPSYTDLADGPAALKSVADQVDSTLFTEAGKMATASAALQTSASQLSATAGQQTALLFLGV